MIRFNIGQCEIKTSIQELKKFSNDVYYRYHNSQRGKKISISDDKYPNLKVTGDIFSLQLWVKSEDGEEQRVFLDGDVYLNSAVIHTITLSGTKFSEEIVGEFENVLKMLTKLGDGYCYAEINAAPVRFERGKFMNYPSLISELYNSLPTANQEQHKVLYESLLDGYNSDDM